MPGLASSRRTLIGILSLCAGIGVWEVIHVVTGLAQIFLPDPVSVATALGSLFGHTSIWGNLAVSGEEAGVGYSSAVIVGIVLGVAIGWYDILYAVINPFVAFFNAVPFIALFPLFVIWFGSGLTSKAILIFVGTVFPILFGAIAGTRSADKRLLTAARSFGATDLQMFRTIVLPGAVPTIVSAMRLGVAFALVGMVVAEFLAANSGIGLIIVDAGEYLQTSTLFAALIVVAAVNMFFTFLLRRLERRLDAWRA